MVLNSNSFDNVTNNVGIEWSQQRGDEAFSVAWVDLNNDGLLDLWVSGHGYNGSSPAYPEAKFPARYLNNGDGTFTLLKDDFRQGKGGDTHGTTWIDFDNDGDRDVLVSAGGELGEGNGQNNLFFVNNNGILEEQAGARRLQYPSGRGRSSLWFDYNNDGLLDVLLLEAYRNDGLGGTALFRQNADGTFNDVTSQVGLNLNEPSRYAQLADLTGDGRLDLVIQGTYTYPLKVYDFANGNFNDITNNFPQISRLPGDITNDFLESDAARDSVIGDFNNDGRVDMFLARSKVFPTQSSLFQGTEQIISADLITKQAGEVGFNFNSSGDITVDILDFFGSQNSIDFSQVFIGSSGRNPTAAELAAIINSCSPGCDCSICAKLITGESSGFTLSSSDSSNLGLKSDRSTRGLYVGYDANSQTWQLRLASPQGEILRLAVESTTEITNATRVGFSAVDVSQQALSDVLWMYDSATGQYVDKTVAAGLSNPTLAQSVVAGDFDNDMDLDLYLATGYPSFDLPNILYENDGRGNFRAIELAGGAAGTGIGPQFLDFEIGQRLTVADYDNDGFLDIFAGSTTSRSAIKTYLGTPSQLFHNRGNSNNWIEIDLQGIDSNRDGIGAQVFVTTPDGTTQLREQNSGTHIFAQNAQRLHFGLAQNTVINQIKIVWPSGNTQFLNNVGVNQVLKIVESFSNNILGNTFSNLLFGTESPDRIEGFSGNDTLRSLGGNDSLIGGSGDDYLDAGEGNDSLFGEDGRDYLDGGGGNDYLEGGVDFDTLNGGSGNDTVDYSYNTTGIYGDLSNRRVTFPGFFVSEQLISIENLNGSQGNDTLIGNFENNVLKGNSGNDSLTGNSGNDVLQGGNGSDTLLGNDNNDILSGGADADFLQGGNGEDHLEGNAGNDTLEGNAGKDYLYGNGDRDSLMGNQGNDFLDGGADNDTLDGGDGSDTLEGSYSNDLLLGGAGLDLLEGGEGDDTIIPGNGNDTVVGGNGFDILQENGNFNFVLTDKELTGKGLDSLREIERVVIIAGGGANRLDASSTSQIGTVVLDGLGGRDTLIGGSGNDDLIGRVGADTITGGAGADRFYYFAKNERQDTITDFNPAEDKIVISASGFGAGLTPGILDSSQFVLGTTALDSSDRFLYNINNGRLLFDADGNGGVGSIVIAQLQNQPLINNLNIEIIV